MLACPLLSMQFGVPNVSSARRFRSRSRQLDFYLKDLARSTVYAHQIVAPIKSRSKYYLPAVSQASVLCSHDNIKKSMHCQALLHAAHLHSRTLRKGKEAGELGQD